MSVWKKFLDKHRRRGANPDEKSPTPENQTMFQGFEWHVPADGQHYQRLTRILSSLQDIGFSSVWLPPGCKADNPAGNGYDCYDLWDLGEFEQKQQTRTKWGLKEDLKQLSDNAKELGIDLYWDAVLNHRQGGDHTEKVKLVEVNSEDRIQEMCKPYETEAWLKFDFEGRNGKYSSFQLGAEHFIATDWDNNNGKKGIFKIERADRRSTKREVAQKLQRYLMFNELDYTHPDVQQDVKNWGVWITQEVGLRGFRLDAVQHFSEKFTNAWIDHLSKEFGQEKLFFVGEYWVGGVSELVSYLHKTSNRMSLYDAPLLNNFSHISQTPTADLRAVFSNSLVDVAPAKAVTLVTNHDTQLGQTVETPVTPFFKPLAYSLILLRQGGYPCVFYGDLYGTCGPKAEGPSCGRKLADLILARKLYAYGEQVDYFDQPSCVGWVRKGRWDKKFGCAVIMSTSGPGVKKMEVGVIHKEQVWTDILGWNNEEIVIDEKGHGIFRCAKQGVSIYVRQDAEGRERFPVNFDDNIYSF
ncbi:thermostable alpha-amylase [Pseudovirgaria hyperparasitica]|uniref:Thermostable alpha-amylase n=1 Tax=Pseudovirgaria hyperparasitica TaxID=470096 RepID=A0A6A6W469_9PEZI|nr:thermostable alpha-amylase [Pseudovirgaria hyperparasitica]KAF2756824.1 thermostable alpha-amylase [Pseudovirgaria hyperparasitica]